MIIEIPKDKAIEILRYYQMKRRDGYSDCDIYGGEYEFTIHYIFNEKKYFLSLPE